MKTLNILILLVLTSHQISIAQTEIDWQFNFGGTQHDAAYSILENEDGSIISGGQISSNDIDGDSTATNLNDLFLIKTDQFGNLIWKKFYDKGYGDEYFGSIKPSADGGYIVGGTALVEKEYDGEIVSSFDFWILKLDNEGNIEWERNLGGSDNDWINDIIETATGNIIAVGGRRSIDGDVTEQLDLLAGWVVMLTNEGEIIWDKSFGAGINDYFTSISPCNTAGYIIAGQQIVQESDGNHSNSFVIKIEENGDLMWNKTFKMDSDEAFPQIHVNPDNSIILASSFETVTIDLSLPAYLTDDFWVIKLSPEGEALWEKKYGTEKNDVLKSIYKTEDDGFILGGTTGDITGPGIDNLPNVNLFLIKIKATGEFEWIQTFGGSSVDILTDIIQTSDGASYLISAYTFSNDGDIALNHGGYDAWIIKLIQETSHTNNIYSSHIEIFPNPSSHQIEIRKDQSTVQGEYSIIFLDGLIVKKGQVSIDASSVFIGDLKSGIYYLKLETAKGTTVSQFVKI